MKFLKVGKGSTQYESKVWKVKEDIRKKEGILNQSRSYFGRTYRQQIVYLYLDNNDVLGFALVRSDGYISLLGVKRDKRKQGIGRKIINRINEYHERISCHTRTSNDDAVNFYQKLGFEIKRSINGYYKNGETAYFLVKGKNDIKTKIKDIFKI